MSATFGAATLPTGVTLPSQCVTKKVAEKESVDIYSYRSEVGVTIHAVPGKLKTSEATLEVIGKASLTLTAGAFTAGTYKRVAVKITEGNEEFPMSTLTDKKFSTLS